MADVDDHIAALQVPALAQAVAQALQGAGERGFVGQRRHRQATRCAEGLP